MPLHHDSADQRKGGVDGKEPLFITRPPKPVSEMTDEERRAYAREVVEAVRRRHRK